MRKWRIWLAVAVWALAILIQKPLWFGQGGWFHVGELEHKLVEAKQDIEHEKTENEALVAEVRSLKEGTTAIEERARRELYMVRNGEVLFRVKASPEEQAKQALFLSKFTVTCSIPGNALTHFSTRDEQAAHVIPVTSYFSCRSCIAFPPLCIQYRGGVSIAIVYPFLPLLQQPF